MCVGPVRTGSFAPIWHRRCTTWGRGFGQSKSKFYGTHAPGPSSGVGFGNRSVLIRSEWGLLTRYGTSGAPYWEKSSVKKSQHITSSTDLGPGLGPRGTRCVLLRSGRGLFPRYGTACAPYTEKDSVKVSQPKSGSTGPQAAGSKL
jgi:hypothetical protein